MTNGWPRLGRGSMIHGLGLGKAAGGAPLASAVCWGLSLCLLPLLVMLAVSLVECLLLIRCCSIADTTRLDVGSVAGGKGRESVTKR
jgi:hypothetical protein